MPNSRLGKQCRWAATLRCSAVCARRTTIVSTQFEVRYSSFHLPRRRTFFASSTLDDHVDSTPFVCTHRSLERVSTKRPQAFLLSPLSPPCSWASPFHLDTTLRSEDMAK